MQQIQKYNWLLVGLFLPLIFFLVACSESTGVGVGMSSDGPGTNVAENGHIGLLTLPDLEALDLDGDPLQVVATTSIIGDVVSQVGGQAIDLTVLIGQEQDPHGFVPAAQDLTAVAEADVLFVNGWYLEEGLAGDLLNIGRDVPVIAISANIEPLMTGNDDQHATGADPHVWLSISNVRQWVKNVETVLGNLDPGNKTAYETNAAAYMAELDALEAFTNAELAKIPPQNRLLVTNHDSLGYFAQDYDFEIIGTVIPGASNLSEPSANDLAKLITTMKNHDLCVLFGDSAVSDDLARTAGAELDNCEAVQVLPLNTGSTGPTGSYVGMYKENVETIVAGLR